MSLVWLSSKNTGPKFGGVTTFPTLFFHLEILVICTIIVWQLTVTVFTSLYFQSF